MLYRRRKKNRTYFYAVLATFSLLAGALWGGLSAVPSFAASNPDMSGGLMQSRVIQRSSGDCAVAALATVEAYMNGLGGNSQAAYDTIWNGNGQQNYIQSWTNLGYRYYGLDTDFGGDQQAFCQSIYEQLEKGVPCLVRRNSSPTHYGVVAAYNGDPQNFQLQDFTVLEVSQYTSEDNALMDLQTWMNLSGGTQLNQLVVREIGAGDILPEEPDRPDQQPSITLSDETHPAHVQQQGEFCPIKGKITSANRLAKVTAGVWDEGGAQMFYKSVPLNTRSYDLIGVNNDMAISKLGTGSYVYRVTAADVSGYEQTLMETHFTVENNGKDGSQISGNSTESGEASASSSHSDGASSDFSHSGGASAAGTANVIGAADHSSSKANVDDAKVIALQINNPMMEINGVAVPIDSDGTAPVIQDDRTVLPLRAVAEAMGAEVGWDDPSQTVTLAMDGKQLKLQINSGQAWDQNGTSYPLDVPPIIINGRTMLPIRFVAEYFGGKVEWSESSQKIAIACGF